MRTTAPLALSFALALTTAAPAQQELQAELRDLHNQRIAVAQELAEHAAASADLTKARQASGVVSVNALVDARLAHLDAQLRVIDLRVALVRLEDSFQPTGAPRFKALRELAELRHGMNEGRVELIKTRLAHEQALFDAGRCSQEVLSTAKQALLEAQLLVLDSAQRVKAIELEELTYRLAKDEERRNR